MYDKFFVGRDLTSAENNGKQPPISRVTLMLDDENSLTAGDDTGIELVASCPHATQEMVNAILAQVKGKQYQMYSAENANLDPAAELGDGVTVDGMYSVISRVDDDGSGYSGVSAPGESELEDEYPTVGPMTQAFNRKFAQTNSRITKTAERIRLEVLNEVEGLSASIDVRLDSITSQVTGLNGQVSTIKQYVDNITLDVSNGSDSSTITLKSGSATISSKTIKMDGLVTFTGLSSGETTIDGACIKTGKIDADRLNLTGSITFSDLSQSMQDSINSTTSTASGAAGTASTALDVANSLANGTGGGTFINGTTVNSPSIVGGSVIGSTIYFGSYGSSGILRATYGNDGQSYTDVIELLSSNGLVLNCTQGFRIEADKIWINLDISRINFRKNGMWTSLESLLQDASGV